MATFAELVLESIEDNYNHTGMVSKIDHNNKIIYVNPERSHIINRSYKFAKRGAGIGGIGAAVLGGIESKRFNDSDAGHNHVTRIGLDAAMSGLGGGLLGLGAGAGIGALTGLYKKNKEKEEVHRLIRAGYKVKYDDQNEY